MLGCDTSVKATKSIEPVRFAKPEMHLHDSVVNKTGFYTCPYRPLRRPIYNLYASERVVDRTLMYVL